MSQGCCDPPISGSGAAAATDDSCCAPIEVSASSCGCDSPADSNGSVPSSDTQVAALPPWWRDRSLALPAISGLLLVIGLLLEYTGFSGPALAAFIIGLTAGAWTFVPSALKRLVQGRGRARLGIGLLMTIAATGAVILGHLEEAAALAFLFSIAESLEHRAMSQARHGLRALLSLIPDTARVARSSGDVTIPAADVRSGDTVTVGAGERIATDGQVVSGQSWVDTSATTGESIPEEVGPGRSVLAGSLNGSGTLTFVATADGRDNSLTQIVSLVEQAHATKGERARLADRIARPLVPLILLASVAIAVLGSLFGDPGTWIERSLVVLVAASPCALAIAVPVTAISAIGSSSKFGVVIKSGAAFEQLGSIRHIAFDKTGTLTRNQPEVVEVHQAPGWDTSEVLRFAAALESASSHPLAEAIVSAAADRHRASDISEQAGLGLSGTVNGHTTRVGSPRWINPGELASQSNTLASRGMTTVVVEVDDEPVGVIGIRDELKPDAAEAINALHSDGITTAIVTGDNSATAHALAQRAGITDVHAEQRPADKADYIRRISETTPTAMIGDGINDAPALASSTVGIAMGATGSAAAVESADVAFTGNDLRLIPLALRHARRGRTIMLTNIALALAIIIVLPPLALFGVLGLAAVVLIHEVAEVVVIANGIRAARRAKQARLVTASPKEPVSVV